MDKIKKGLSNQAIGYLPVLLLMYLDNYFSYTLSFLISIVFCFACIFLFHTLVKERIYQFSLLPSACTLTLYAFFLPFPLHPALTVYTPIIVEVLLVAILAVMSFYQLKVLSLIRKSALPAYKKVILKSSINEFFFVSRIYLILFGFHVLFLFLYTIFREALEINSIINFLYRDIALVGGLLIIIYEQIRTSLMRGHLSKEMWLPILNDKAQVIGSMARSVSISSPQKYFHPIVRIAVIYKGMLYLCERDREEMVSPRTQDIPYCDYVLFRHTIQDTVKRMIGTLSEVESVKPHFLVRYTFENERVKQLVSLYVIRIHSELLLKSCPPGKLWTSKQMEENLNCQIFSEYFESEFNYLQNTILVDESEEFKKYIEKN